jgi:hypothetical protein
MDVARCLVKDLGANVEERFEGFSPLHAAAQEGRMAVMLCLVKELGANVDQPTQDGSYHLLHVATHTRAWVSFGARSTNSVSM